MKKRKKVVESTESVKEPALKVKARVKTKFPIKAPKPCRDKAQKAPRTGPLNNNIVINSQMGANRLPSANKANKIREGDL